MCACIEAPITQPPSLADSMHVTPRFRPRTYLAYLTWLFLLCAGRWMRLRSSIMDMSIRDTGITVVHEPGSGCPIVESVLEAIPVDFN